MTIPKHVTWKKIRHSNSLSPSIALSTIIWPHAALPFSLYQISSESIIKVLWNSVTIEKRIFAADVLPFSKATPAFCSFICIVAIFNSVKTLFKGNYLWEMQTMSSDDPWEGFLVFHLCFDRCIRTV